jgi:hypothetical protein
MGHKAVVIIDLDHMDGMSDDPIEFVRRLQMAVLAPRFSCSECDSGHQRAAR